MTAQTVASNYVACPLLCRVPDRRDPHPKYKMQVRLRRIAGVVLSLDCKVLQARPERSAAKLCAQFRESMFWFNLTRLPLRANTQEYATTPGEC